jgi:hypothetical protein
VTSTAVAPRASTLSRFVLDFTGPVEDSFLL